MQGVDCTDYTEHLAKRPQDEFLGALFAVIGFPKVSQISAVGPRKYEVANGPLLTGSD
jgi:hypothetical protein